MKKTLLLPVLLLAATSLFAQQIVTLKSGEKMNGKVVSLNNGVVEFIFKGSTMKLNTSEIYSINFSEAAAGGESTAVTQREAGEKQVTANGYVVRYKVADRVIAKPPKIDNLTQEKGTVVVEISIDKYGHVIKAVPGAPGSTTSSDYLKTKAKQAAESAIFDNVPTAPLEQKGYMTIAF